MSELIEVHQLDYKACSLTYGEGACTAEAGTRPAGHGVASFNNSSSRIELPPIVSNNHVNFTVECDFTLLADASANNASEVYIYTENTNPIDKNLHLVVTAFGDVSVGIRESSFSWSFVTSNYSGGFTIDQSYKLKYEFTVLNSSFYTVEYIY